MTITLNEFVRRMRLVTRTSLKTISTVQGPGKASIGQLWRLEKKATRFPDKPVLERLEFFFGLPVAFLYKLHGPSTDNRKPSHGVVWDLTRFETKILSVPDAAPRQVIGKLKAGMMLPPEEAEQLVVLLDDSFLDEELVQDQ